MTDVRCPACGEDVSDSPEVDFMEGENETECAEWRQKAMRLLCEIERLQAENAALIHRVREAETVPLNAAARYDAELPLRRELAMAEMSAQNEREAHAAWQKRAEAAEADLAALRAQLAEREDAAFRAGWGACEKWRFQPAVVCEHEDAALVAWRQRQAEREKGGA